MSTSTSATATSAVTSAPAATTTSGGAGSGVAQNSVGLNVLAFFTALSTALIVFGIQMGLFMLLRNRLARIFKPKTFLVPERERTEPPPVSPWGLLHNLLQFKDREIIKKCGLDAYFFLRYLQTLLVIFIPVCLVVIPILIPVNYIDGIGQSLSANNSDSNTSIPTGLDTIAWGNVKPTHTRRRWAHLILALLVIIWVCYVCFSEFRVYIKIRQDYLTSAEHRLRASANTVLVSGIPDKWLTEDALRGLFDVFPGGIRNIWLTRDFTKLLDKIQKRDEAHQLLEAAETDLIKMAKKKQLKRRAAEEKKTQKSGRAQAPTKAEVERRDREEDANAQRMAAGSGGMSAGNHEEVVQMDDLSHHSDTGKETNDIEPAEEQKLGFKLPVIGGGIAKVGQGLMGGVGKAGQGILGGAKAIQQGVGSELNRTGGFEFVKAGDAGEASERPPTRGSDRPRRVVQLVENERRPRISSSSDRVPSRHSHTASAASHDEATPRTRNFDPRQHRNTIRKVDNIDNVLVTEESRWWQFWRPPTGAYASPVPQGSEGDEFPFRDGEHGDEEHKSFWQKAKSVIPFLEEDEVPVEYPSALNPGFQDGKDDGAEWEKWVKASDRPTHRLAWFDWTPTWLPGLPLVHKKVDTIYWCRKELARLNMEIEEDQQHQERYATMNSAFIQFNNQVAAHMACQSVTHHVPKQMAPRMVEVSPNDVLWDNMAIKWWDEWLRIILVIAVVFGMTILWAFPVAFSSSLSQIDSLAQRYPWLGFLTSTPTIYNLTKAIAGVLPPLLLAILLALVPIIFNFLAGFQGAKTGAQRSEYVQIYYFFFLFVQVFLVVSISSGAIATLQDTISNVQSIPDVLALNLPKAANYFYTYMILQALSTSSGTLLQIGTLVVWYLVARLFDNTARAKWSRQTGLPTLTWASYFPVYTNFACIALVYTVIAPLISLFAIVIFSLFWFANRYNVIYVTRFKVDTGGVLYPRALNQTFTGLYFMELCLVGLFFLVRDENNNAACVPQAIIMIVALILTALYQIMLNRSFGPLLRYLPITFEDEAVLRDEAFQRAQDRRLGIDHDDDEAGSLLANETTETSTDADIEMRKISNRGRQGTGGHLQKLNPVKGLAQASNWAVRRGQRVRHATIGKAEGTLRNAAEYRQQRRLKDLEAQRAIGEALYGGYHDEIEDLTPEERDALVREAFKHEALRARRPTVWIPRDDLGVSDDEIVRTREVSDHIWISNEGTALDSKVRVVYGRAPPDFSDLELIDL